MRRWRRWACTQRIHAQYWRPSRWWICSPTTGAITSMPRAAARGGLAASEPCRHTMLSGPHVAAPKNATFRREGMSASVASAGVLSMTGNGCWMCCSCSSLCCLWRASLRTRSYMNQCVRTLPLQHGGVSHAPGDDTLHTLRLSCPGGCHLTSIGIHVGVNVAGPIGRGRPWDALCCCAHSRTCVTKLAAALRLCFRSFCLIPGIDRCCY